jgi:DUF1365 family protein
MNHAGVISRDAFAHRLYVGDVMHMRLRPFGHKFRYRVFTSLLDIDRLEQATLPVFRINRFGLFSFSEKDHGPRDGSPLRPWVEALLDGEGLPRPDRIMLLSMPRFLGFAFNPLSVYYCYRADGALQSVVYEVKNTFGDQIPYVIDIRTDADGAARHEQAKGMFVSPFIEMDQTYRFTIRPPGEKLALRIKQSDGGGDTLIAAQNGTIRPLTSASLLKLTATHPLAALKVVVAIHWQALKLAIKGAKFHRYPGSEGAYKDEKPSQIAASS